MCAGNKLANTALKVAIGAVALTAGYIVGRFDRKPVHLTVNVLKEKPEVEDNGI